MTTDSERITAALERLSTLVDGELDAGAVAQACAHWRDSAESRSSWHVYHLIGDVLRSDDLAGDATRDAEFLRGLRVRLAGEPVVLAPRPLESGAAVAVNGAKSNRWGWMAPSAVAAGFVAVAGVLMLTRAPGTLPARGAEASLAQMAASAGAQVALPVAATLASSMVNEPQTFVASGKLIRDARLDRYLDAHKQFAGSSALGVPSAFLRSATTVNASDR